MCIVQDLDSNLLSKTRNHHQEVTCQCQYAVLPRMPSVTLEMCMAYIVIIIIIYPR